MIKKYVLERLLHAQKVNQLRVLSALLDDALDVVFGLFNKIVDGLDAAKYAVLVFIFVNAQVRLTWDQQPVLVDQTPDTKA